MKNPSPEQYISPKNPFIVYWIFETLPSTHIFALQQKWSDYSKELENNRLIVIFAARQMCGVGSHQRKWISNNIDFHINCVFFTRKILPFTQLAAFTVCQLLGKETQQPLVFHIKWPNDVYVDGKKISGSLSYIRHFNGKYKWVTVGVGINYNLDAFSSMDQPATSLKCFLKKHETFSRNEIFDAVQDFSRLFLQNLNRYNDDNLNVFYDDCRSYWLYLNQSVTLFDEDQKKQLAGIFEGVDEDGRLQLRLLKNDSRIYVMNGTGLQLVSEK